MSVEVVVGTNWGDEGKGRMVDYLAQRADVVIRYQGGNNAGHTVVNHLGTFRLHLIPSGIFHANVTNVLGPGMVVDLEAFNHELENLRTHGIDISGVRLSERATICFPFHRLLDAWEEERLGDELAYGSTRRGIAPAYGDRYLKKAIQVGELLFPDHLERRVRELVEWANVMMAGAYRRERVTFEEVWDWINTYGSTVREFVCDTTTLLAAAAGQGKRILFEAQLGALRDVYFGIYPYTSSSCTLASFAPIGGGLLGHAPDRVVGVMKSFSTCVGAGPFVTEMCDDEAAELREIAEEYGAATGRPRRIGHFDAVASRYGTRLQGATEIALTKLDSLSGRDLLRVCIAYRVADRVQDTFPLNPALEQAQPVYIEMPGWSEDISSTRHFEQLPQAAQDYVSEIERQVGCRVRYVSVGPERESLIDREA